MATRRTAKKAKHATRRVRARHAPKHEANLGQKEARLVMAAESELSNMGQRSRRKKK
jgi:hypothetical protein